MRKQLIKEMQLQGCNPAYSGKQKTIFVDKYPDGTTMANAEKNGLKVYINEKQS